MGTLKHFILENYCYFVTTAVRERIPIFRNPEMANVLLKIFALKKSELDFDLHGYVVMPDHFHALITPPSKYSISVIMRQLKGASSREINQICQRTGSLWQKGFHEHVIRDERDFILRLEYMHNNAVNAGLVETPNNYEFSSYLDYYEDRKNCLVQIDQVLW
jgi:putative transposase